MGKKVFSKDSPLKLVESEIDSYIEYRDDEVEFEKEVELVEGLIDYIVNDVFEYEELKTF